MRDRCRRDPLTGVAAETAATAWAALPDLATDIDGIDLAAAGAALSDGNTRDALMFFPPGPDCPWPWKSPRWWPGEVPTGGQVEVPTLCSCRP